MFWQFHLAVIKYSYKTCNGIMFLGRGLPFTNSDYPVLVYFYINVISNIGLLKCCCYAYSCMYCCWKESYSLICCLDFLLNNLIDQYSGMTVLISLACNQ